MPSCAAVLKWERVYRTEGLCQLEFPYQILLPAKEIKVIVTLDFDKQPVIAILREGTEIK